MANGLYDPGREGFLDGSIDWLTGTSTAAGEMRVMLVKSGYSFVASHKFVSDLGANDNGRSALFVTKTVANGVADAADISITGTAAAACNALVIYQNANGVDGASRLIAYIDTATGLPVTPAAGGVVNIAFDAGSNKIFKL